MKIILASQSPRRSAILSLTKIEFEVLPSSYEKKIEDGENIEEQSKEVAYLKAKDVFNNTQGDRAIIGADTIVVKNNKVFGKPKDREDAIRMLKELENDSHIVYTSFSILIEDHGKYKEYKDISKSIIELSHISDEEIIDYIDSEEPYDKAGAYAIQSSFCKFVKKIEGSYMGIVGLPIDRIYQILKENEII